MVAATTGFSMMHVAIRYISADLHPFQIMFFRNFFGLIIFIPLIWRSGLGTFRTKRLPVHLLRAGLNVMAMGLYFTALSLTPVAQVTALGFTAPLFAGVLSAVVLGEQFRLRRWMAIILGFVGALVILRPGFQELDLGSTFALIASLIWGVTLIVIRVLGRTESSATTTIYMSVLLSALSFIPALIVWQTPTVTTFMLLILLAVVGTAAQLGLAQALKEADAMTVMPFDFTKLIWAALLGYLIFAEVPDIFIWIGGTIIFSSGIYLAYRENKIGKSRPIEPAGPPGA